MTTAKRFFDPCLYLAYTFILFSYLTTNVLILRLNLVLSAICFIVWGVIYPETAIQLDTVIYNALFIIINLYNSIPLFREILPVKMTPLEEISYERDFKNFLSRREFIYFFDHFKKITATNDKTVIVNKGMTFDGLVYIARLNSDCEIFLRKDNENLKSLKEGSWLGIIEYMFHNEMKKSDKSSIVWGINVVLETKSVVNSTQNEMIRIEGEGIDYYLIDLDTLFKLYNDGDYPYIFKNALQALWLIYTTNYIIEQDIELLKFQVGDEKLLKSKF